MYILQLVVSLFLVLGLCDGLDFKTTECEQRCKTKEISNNDKLTLCKEICEQEFLGLRVKQGYKGGLPTPVVPRIVGTGWDDVKLNLNTTALRNYSGLYYILEVEPVRNLSQTNVNVDTIFPYIAKYHLTNETTYSVRELEPNTGYKFRVIAIRSNASSEYSGWSNITWTTKNCPKPPCSVTNLRLELTSRVPYKGMARLKSVLYWEPTTLSSTYKKYFSHYELKRISHIQSMCALQFDDDDEQIRKGTTRLDKKDIFTNKSLAFYEPEKELIKTYLYYDCWYTFQLSLKQFTFTGPIGERKWIIHTPDCITVNHSKICGCPYVPTEDEKKHGVLNVTVVQLSNASSTAYLEWSDHLWRSLINVTYFFVTIHKISYKMFHDTHINVHRYNDTIYGLETGEKYSIQISAYYKDHCAHEKVEKVDFYARNKCIEEPPLENGSCEPDFYLGKCKCVCDSGYYLSKDEPRRCIAIDICQTKPCGANQTCSSGKGIRICECIREFVNMNGTCVPDNCKFNPNATKCMTTTKSGNKDTATDSEAIIAGVVPALIVVIMVAVGVIIWLRYFHTKRINFLQREFEDAIASGTHTGTLTNPYDYQHPIELDPLSEGSSKEMNLLYVLQEDLVISEDLKGSISSFELPGEHVSLGSMIGKGAFGEVYIGEALGVNNNHDWTTVAIKTLAEVVKEEDVYDFLREIELMKDIGKHENVIQMYGCCTKCRPICLVLEYASGGNLLNYLRSLKKKCKEIAAARVYAFMNSEKEKFQKFFEPGEMPDPSTSYSFPNDPYKRPRGTEEAVKEAEALNLEVASKMKEELQTALDPKELESFARQIACGMEHIANIGIVHRDLAARNILLDGNKVLKISDFGLSREGTYVKRTQGKIPFRWLSIEAIRERLYSKASDVWAFGIVLWEICTLGDVPYPAVSDRDLEDFLLSGKRMAKVESCTDDIYEIMLKCWNHLPENRPTFTELSKYLWDLEHNGNTYVNVESFVKQSVDDQGNEKQDEEKKENNNIDDKPDAESDIASNGGFDNQGFCLSEEDLKASDEKKLIRKHKNSLPKTTLDEDASNGIVGNGVKNEATSSKTD